MTGIVGRRIQISGSAGADTDVSLVRYAHRVVRGVVPEILRQGGGIVTAVGKEPRSIESDSTLPSLVFDWTVLEAVGDAYRAGILSWPATAGAPIVVVASEKAEAEIPTERRALWAELRDSGIIRLESIMAGSRAAAFIRERQAQFGDVLVTLGGGTGVEHLADVYLAANRCVIPLDLPIGSSRGDGTGGSLRLARESRADPSRFVRLPRGSEDQANVALSGLACRNGAEEADGIVERLSKLLSQLAPSRCFYVRLLNDKHGQFAEVEAFFRKVVDPVVAEAGYERVEMGTDPSEHGFINVGIFESLHFSQLAIVDVTGNRPNCYIELGYALGRGMRCLVTAQEGTELPFDESAIPHHFWGTAKSDSERQEDLKSFWRKNIDRPKLVSPR